MTPRREFHPLGSAAISPALSLSGAKMITPPLLAPDGSFANAVCCTQKRAKNRANPSTRKNNDSAPEGLSIKRVAYVINAVAYLTKNIIGFSLILLSVTYIVGIINDSRYQRPFTFYCTLST